MHKRGMETDSMPFFSVQDRGRFRLAPVRSLGDHASMRAPAKITS